MSDSTAGPAARFPDDPHARDRTAALRLLVVMSRALRAVTEPARHQAKQWDLSSTELGVLEALYHKGPMLLNEVQRRILVSSGGITYLVDRLEKRGLVERRDCPGDRRARLAALTPDGEALLAAIFPQHAAVIRDALRGLDADEKREASRLLRALLDSATSPEAPAGEP